MKLGQTLCGLIVMMLAWCGSAAAAPGQDAGAIPADPARRCLQIAVPGAFDPIEHFAGEEIVQRLEAYFAE